jgi:hypothetical protein
MVRWFCVILSLGFGLALGGCAPTYGAVEQPKTPTATPKAPEAPKPADLSQRGRPEPLAMEFELKGYETVWLKGTGLLVTLKETKWDVIGEDDTPDSREGRAVLFFEEAGKTERRTIVEGQDKVILGGYSVSVSMAYEFYRERDARYLPHAKLSVRRK